MTRVIRHRSTTRRRRAAGPALGLVLVALIAGLVGGCGLLRSDVAPRRTPRRRGCGAKESAASSGGANFQCIAISPNGCWVYGADASKNNQVVPVNAVTDTAGAGIVTDPGPSDIAVAYPPVTYYYEVEGTRDLWTSPASGQASLAFGQPAHST